MLREDRDYYCPECSTKMGLLKEGFKTVLRCEKCGKEVADTCPHCSCLLEGEEKPADNPEKLTLRCIFSGCGRYLEDVWYKPWRSTELLKDRYEEILRSAELPLTRNQIGKELGRYPFPEAEKKVIRVDFEELLPHRDFPTHVYLKMAEDILNLDSTPQFPLPLFTDSEEKVQRLKKLIEEYWEKKYREALKTIVKRMGIPFGRRGVGILRRELRIREDEAGYCLRKLENLGYIKQEKTLRGRMWLPTLDGEKMVKTKEKS